MRDLGRILGFSILTLGAAGSFGCGDLLTLHGLYTKQSQVFDPAIEGRWESDDNIADVHRNGDLYEVSLSAKKGSEKSSKIEMHLVDIGGGRFADLLPEDQIGHMILRVRLSGAELRTDFFDSKWLRQQVPHDEADIENFRKQAILTQSTNQLRALVSRFAHNEKAFADPVIFKRASEPRR